MSKTIRNCDGRSSGIGLELATICAQEGLDLLSREYGSRFDAAAAAFSRASPRAWEASS